MVGLLVAIKMATVRHSLTGSRKALMLIGGGSGLLAAGITVALCLAQGSSPASINPICTLYLVWTAGWLVGPMLAGGDTALNPEYFRTLPIPKRRLAPALLASTFVGVPPLVTAPAFLGLPLYAAQLGPVPLAFSIPASGLQFIATVLLARVIGRLIGQTTGSRIGIELAAIAQGAFIAFICIGWFAIPPIADAVNSQSPIYSSIVRALPSGWAAVAVDSARQGHWALALGALAGLLGICGLLGLLWTRLLDLGAAGGTVTHRSPDLSFIPGSRVGAVVMKELLTWWRDPARGRFLRMGMWLGIALAALAWLDGQLAILPWIGPFTVLAMAAAASNVYGFDGSALWITLTSPGGARSDVRGRQVAWLLAVAPITLFLTLVLDALSRQAWSWHVTAALLPALLGIGSGVLVLASLFKPVPAGDPARRNHGIYAAGDDLNIGDLQVEGLLAAGLILLALAPLLALTLVADASGYALLQAAAIAAGVAGGCLAAWWLGRVACRRLEARGPELLSLLKAHE